ncbi:MULTISPECIES: sigma-70 family RNA polymerase sigma factor [unclassified Cellulomonas]|uniref:sigma-70 family RNA polymerase sigma factor n=1 Tax=unclassified Cellulomonas TaxID=2620175 RepID=UPI0019C9AA98|nr:sigma-70 family RNA polymerase sigma factor [Cellulomonas sp. ES6]MBD3780936.1 sigma-70 family RNA polymerase sigma factor [Micrococcales bacterium]WHP19233.1 sigma-70 family RNA polymerase sigma factor [Cellulomonas sp. ES6]
MIAALARDRGRALVAYAYLLTGDLRDAEDLVQDALVKTVVRTRTGVDLQTVEGYVRRTILTTFVDGRRRARRWRDLLPRLAGPEETLPDLADGVTVRQEVRAALAELPARQRACTVLRYLDDLPVADIADVLDLSTGAVKRYLADARGRLGLSLGNAPDGSTREDRDEMEHLL